MREAKIGIDSNFYIYKVSETETSVIHVYEGYRKDITAMKDKNNPDKFVMSPWIVNYWGIWREKFGIVSIGIPFWERRANLTGVNLICSTVHNPPYQAVTLLTGEKEGQVNITGYIADIWHILQRMTNFDYAMYPSVDGGWGSKQPDGTWSGQIGMILRGEVEFSIADFSITLERSRMVDFSEFLLYSRINMFIRTPSRDVGWSTFVKPLSHGTWIVTVTILLASSLMISITYYINKRESSYDVEYPNSFGFNMSIFLTLSALFQQGSVCEPKTSSTRVVAITIFFTTSLIFIAYTAALTSFLAIYKVNMPFWDLKTLYDDTNYKIGSIRNTVYDDVFKSGSELDKKVFKDRYEFVDSVSEGLEKSYNEKYAFIWESDNIEFVLGQKCSHMAVPNKVQDFPVAFVMKQNLPYKSMFNYFLIKLQQTGQISRMWSLWKSEIDSRKNRKDCFDAEASSQGIFNVLVAFLNFNGAIIVSLSIMACEIIYKRSASKTMPTATKGNVEHVLLLENIRIKFYNLNETIILFEFLDYFSKLPQ